MCRITVDTCVRIDPSMRRLFFDRALLASNADGQHDGVGVTDGLVVSKTHSPYLHVGSGWLTGLANDRFWIGHVRAASRNTEISPHASHPFRFRLDDGRVLMAAHNGFIKDMPAAQGNEPKVDSYQAFKLLVALLNERGGDITAELVNAWTAQFGADSQWAFALELDGHVTLLRGNRELHYVSIDDNGFLFNTSPTVLLSVKDWALTYWGRMHKFGRITEIKAFQMVTVRAGTSVLVTQAINPQALSPSYEGMYIHQSETTDQLIKL